MAYSNLTNQVRISNQSSPRNSTIDTFLIHHQAGTNDDAVIAAMVSASRGVSANYTISNEGRITCVVPEERRAWTSGSPYDGGKGAAWDHRAVTVEIENESGAPDWRISGKALDSAARLLRDLRARYAIRNVLGHRDLWNTYRASYATFCPGPSTVAQIVALANIGSIPAGGGSTPIPAPTPEEQEKDMELIYIRPANGTVVDTGVKGVIGDINMKFTAESRTHFMALWGTPEKPRNERVHISYHNVQVGDVQDIFDMFIPASDKQVRNLVVPSSGGGSADVTPILSAVAGVSAQISNFPTAPTAEENGAATLAAARAAIAKS